MIEIPVHVKKLVKEYTAGRIKPTDVQVSKAADGNVSKDVYQFTLSTFNILGDEVGTHEFALTLESLVDTRNRVVADLEEYASKVDAFVADYNALISVLQDISNKKKSG